MNYVKHGSLNNAEHKSVLSEDCLSRKFLTEIEANYLTKTYLPGAIHEVL
jgi:hypothetical protein